MPGRGQAGTPAWIRETLAPQQSPGTTTTNMVVVGVLIGLICVLSIILVILLVRPVMIMLQSYMPDNGRRKEMRYQTVEGWLISKRLRKHDQHCAYAMEHFGRTHGDRSKPVEPSKIAPATSYDTAETVLEESMEVEWRECPICMEDFKANEVVSWSPDDQTSCPHFFHHECIKEWLLRSPHCPYCRSTIIPVDDEARGKKVARSTLLEMSKRRVRKVNSSFCCLEHGLVAICKPAKPNTHDKVAWDSVLLSRVDGTDLVAKRGGRHESNDDHQNETSNGSSASIDMELSSIIISRGAPQAPTVLSEADALPPSRRLADVETGIVRTEGSVLEPPSCSYVQLSDEQTSCPSGSQNV